MSDVKNTILKHGVLSITGECKGCDRCFKACPTGAITINGLGTKHVIDPDKCVNCGQCLINCPFDRIKEISMLDDVRSAIADPNKHVIVQMTPAVRAGLLTEYKMNDAVSAQSKLYSALRGLGFDTIHDTVFGADLTIMEEGYELIGRINKAFGTSSDEHAGDLPQFTSCCPGWVRFAELYYPELLPLLSTARSPMMMQGSCTKAFMPQKIGVAAKDIYNVAIMPCTAKRFEASRPEFIASGYDDMDAVITTRELIQWMKDENMNFVDLEEGETDPFMGTGSGAGVIFGNTGGVMEAALRTAYEVLSGQPLQELRIEAVRGQKGVRSATVPIPLKGTDQVLDLKVAIVSGSQNVHQVAKDAIEGTSEYHFIEVMNCPSGCVNGGGQPIDRTIF
ncbi:MAG: [FeFe] hydrogenase, group A [Eggerthellaceae bacterium]